MLYRYFSFKTLLGITKEQKQNKKMRKRACESAVQVSMYHSLRKKCPYSEFFWSVFSHVRTEYGEILRLSPYSVRMRENKDKKNSEYGHFTQ